MRPRPETTPILYDWRTLKYQMSLWTSVPLPEVDGIRFIGSHSTKYACQPRRPAFAATRNHQFFFVASMAPVAVVASCVRMTCSYAFWCVFTTPGLFCVLSVVERRNCLTAFTTVGLLPVTMLSLIHI